MIYRSCQVISYHDSLPGCYRVHDSLAEVAQEPEAFLWDSPEALDAPEAKVRFGFFPAVGVCEGALITCLDDDVQPEGKSLQMISDE